MNIFDLESSASFKSFRKNEYVEVKERAYEYCFLK